MQIKAYPITNNFFNRLNLDFQLSATLKELRSNLIRTGNNVYVLETLGKRPDIHAYLNTELNGAFIGCSHKESNHTTNIDCHIKTLYKCDFCSHISDTIGIYHKHVFDSHGQQHFLEIVRSDHEMKSLDALLPQEYSAEALNHVEIAANNTDTLIAKYISDDYEFYETINISREFNEYGVCFFNLQITQYSRDNMVKTSDILCNEYEESMTEKQIAKIDNKADREITKWKNHKAWEIRDSYTCNLSVKADITSETNYSNYTHEQYFKAVTIECTTQDTKKLKALIAAKDIIINLYLNQ
jgi:hypothetical protein